jgi:hypothetical protein
MRANYATHGTASRHVLELPRNATGTRWLAEPLGGHDHVQPIRGGTRMAGMIRKLVASGIAAKVIQEARKPENQAKIKKFIADYQAKQKGGGKGHGRSY